jgi:hypothetical protein
MVLKASPKRRLGVRAVEEGRASGSPLVSDKGVQIPSPRRMVQKSVPERTLKHGLELSGAIPLSFRPGREEKRGGAMEAGSHALSRQKQEG